MPRVKKETKPVARPKARPKAQPTGKTGRPGRPRKEAVDAAAGDPALTLIMDSLGSSKMSGLDAAYAEALAMEILIRRAMVAQREDNVSKPGWVKAFGESTGRFMTLARRLDLADLAKAVDEFDAATDGATTTDPVSKAGSGIKGTDSGGEEQGMLR